MDLAPAFVAVVLAVLLGVQVLALATWIVGKRLRSSGAASRRRARATPPALPAREGAPPSA